MTVRKCLEICSCGDSHGVGISKTNQWTLDQVIVIYGIFGRE